MMIEAGTSVEGYRVERLIGRGGMGVVYEAVQTSLERPVALKVLRPELADDPEFVERFRREGRLQASLEHPHVLDVYEVGESEHGLFLSMRLVTGQTLLDLLRDGELDAERSLKLLDQVTGALDFAHEADLVHRDVKPQNVLIGEGDHAYLADFGLTRGSTDTTVASTGPMLGSVAYVAPEIVRGEEPTPASDRYSFAATVFHCLTGDVVFPLGSDAAVLFAHAAEPPPSVRRAPGRAPAGPRRGDGRGSRQGAGLATQVGQVHHPRGARRTWPAGNAARLAAGRRPVRARGSAARHAASSSRRKRPGLKLAAMTGVLLAGVALAVAAAFVLDDDEGSAADRPEVALPLVQEGATVLGSELGIPDRSVDCEGDAATPQSTPCAMVQAELPGQDLLIPSDGVITGWTVRGAQGEIALNVIRPRGADTIRIARSQVEFAGNAAPHHYETRIPVEAGDQIGIELTPGASIGVSDTEGATTLRWLEPVGGFYEAPDKAEGTGFDYEVALQAEFVPGAEVKLPRSLTGAAAANAPVGRVRDTSFAEVDKPSAQLRLELSEVDGKVVLDVFEEGKRNVRVFIPDLEPGGLPVDLKVHDAPGEPTVGAEVRWVNPTLGRLNFQAFILTREGLEFAGY